MAVRYEGDDRFPDLELNDKVNNGSSPLHGKMSVLLKWHKQDPVDQIERNRNEIIYQTYQHNRNPLLITLNGQVRFGNKKGTATSKQCLSFQADKQDNNRDSPIFL